MHGPQVDVGKGYWGSLYGEGVGGMMKASDPAKIKAVVKEKDFNEYHIIARGNRLQHYINGVLMSDVTDNDTRFRRMRGLLGVQVHTGPPMKVEYRNFRVKPL